MSFEYEQKKQAYDSCALSLESNISKIEQVNINSYKILLYTVINILLKKKTYILCTNLGS